MKNRSITNEAVRFTVNTKELEGILTHPTADAPYPALVLLHGSDRAGRNDAYYTQHAENLTDAGFAVLRYDGPGWGGRSSEGAGFETLEYRTEEAIAAVKYLQSRLDIKSKVVGLWGISQGGWICQMSAAAYDGVAFIIPVSGPGVTPVEQEVFRVGAESRAAGLDENEIAKAVLMRRLMADLVLTEPEYQNVNVSESQRLGHGPWSDMAKLAYDPGHVDLATEHGQVMQIFTSIQDERWAQSLHLEQVLPMLSSLPPQAWGMAKAQLKAVMDVNPADFLSRVHCPVLAIFGENDTSIPVDKSIALYKQYLGAAGNRTFSIKVFPKASHTIRVGEGFAPGYFDLMIDWLKSLPVK